MTTAYDLAMRHVGIREFSGDKDHPLVQWWLSLCGYDLDTHDEVPWCSAFVNGMAWLLNLPRTKSAAARSWLALGTPIISLTDCRAAYDVVILKRGGGDQPGPDVLQAQGHVGFFAGFQGGNLLILGGNQSNGVQIDSFPRERLLGIRRLAQL